MIANLTFDEPTEEEQLFADIERAEMLGAKDVIISGFPFRIIAWEFGGRVAEFFGYRYNSDRSMVKFKYKYAVDYIEDRYKGHSFWSHLADRASKEIDQQQLAMN